MTGIVISGVDPNALAVALSVGVDHGGNPIEPFIDADGGWPLRCCLSDSLPGEQIAIIAWSPFPWRGPYAEIGPIVVHADGCAGPGQPGLPGALDERAMTLRPYGPDHRIAYHRVRHIAAGESLIPHLEALLAEDDVELVHGRNTTGGCYAFTAHAG